MIIDFHTHAFNEKIVEKALASLTANSGLMPHGNGTVQSLVCLLYTSDAADD